MFQPHREEPRLLAAEPNLLSGGWQLQLAVAAALCMAEGSEMYLASWEGMVEFYFVRGLLVVQCVSCYSITMSMYYYSQLLLLAINKY